MIIKWCAVLLMLLGLWLLANKGRFASWGFVSFVMSSLLFICFAWQKRNEELVAVWIIMLIISIQGINKGDFRIRKFSK
jgi:uncharacterized membrane protein YhhN